MIQSASGGPPCRSVEPRGEIVQVGHVRAREEGLAQDDEIGPERVDLRLEDSLRHRPRVHAGSERQREGRRQRDEALGRKRRDVALVERNAEARLALRMGGAVEGVRVEEARERAALEAVRRLDERAEDVLPAQHPVGEEVDPGILLGRDELLEIALDLRVDGVLCRPAAIEVARRLDELLRAGIDAWYECLHVSSLPSRCLERTEREALRAL